MSSYVSSANARSKRKMLLKQQSSNQAKRRMFTSLFDVISHFLNEDNRRNIALPLHGGDNNINVDNRISNQQNLLEKFDMAASIQRKENQLYCNV